MRDYLTEILATIGPEDMAGTQEVMIEWLSNNLPPRSVSGGANDADMLDWNLLQIAVEDQLSSELVESQLGQTHGSFGLAGEVDPIPVINLEEDELVPVLVPAAGQVPKEQVDMEVDQNEVVMLDHCRLTPPPASSDDSDWSEPEEEPVLGPATPLANVDLDSVDTVVCTENKAEECEEVVVEDYEGSGVSEPETEEDNQKVVMEEEDDQDSDEESDREMPVFFPEAYLPGFADPSQAHLRDNENVVYMTNRSSWSNSHLCGSNNSIANLNDVELDNLLDVTDFDVHLAGNASDSRAIVVQEETGQTQGSGQSARELTVPLRRSERLRASSSSSSVSTIVALSDRTSDVTDLDSGHEDMDDPSFDE